MQQVLISYLFQLFISYFKITFTFLAMLCSMQDLIPDQGSNTCLLQWKLGMLTSKPPEKSHQLSRFFFFLTLLALCCWKWGHSLWRRAGFSSWYLLLLQSTGYRAKAQQLIVAHRLSCFKGSSPTRNQVHVSYTGRKISGTTRDLSVIYFIYSSVYMSILISQVIPLLPFNTSEVSQRVPQPKLI